MEPNPLNTNLNIYSSASLDVGLCAALSAFKIAMWKSLEM